MLDLELQGKVAIITGGGSGIGQATAYRFAQEGAKTTIVCRRSDCAKETAEGIRQMGGEVLPLEMDITVPENVTRIVNETVDKYGKLDILVNAAGILQSGSIESTTLEMWDRMMALNLRAMFLLMHEAVPHLIESKGNIVNVSSVNGPRSFPNVLAYNVSKSGVDQLTRCAALELAAKGVRVNAINPGVMRTNLHKAGGMDLEAYAKFLEHSKTTHPLGRVGQPEEAADLIAFLASPRAAFITGATVNIDGGRGQTCAR